MFSDIVKISLANLLCNTPAFLHRLSQQKTMAVICYHRIQDEASSDGLSIGPEVLERHLNLIATSKILLNVSAARFENIWKGKEDAEGKIPLLITFDDGYRDNLLYAAPLLQKYGLAAILFIASDILEDRPLWYDLLRCWFETAGSQALQEEFSGIFRWNRRNIPADFGAWMAAIKELPPAAFAAAQERIRKNAPACALKGQYFSAADVRTWVGMGLEVGCHTRSHPRLSRLSRESARAEICESRDLLAKITGHPVNYFAYPFGEENDFTLDNAQDLEALGFAMGFSLINGSNRAGDNPYLVRRNCLDFDAGKTYARIFSSPALQMAMLGIISDFKRRLRWNGRQQKCLRPSPIIPPCPEEKCG